MFREMKNYLLSVFIFVLFTLVHASRVRDSTSAFNFETYFHETPDKPHESPYLQLPIFQHSREPLMDKEQFSPAHGSGREQLSESTRKILIPRLPQRAYDVSGRSRYINVDCSLKKMIVKVNKEVLGPEGFRGSLKLGTCDISKSTKKAHVFVYDMDRCGSRRKFVNNRVTYTNILRYVPLKAPGPVRHAMPFSIKLECHFNRYHYSYKIGFTPQVEYQNYFRPLKTVDSVVLTPRDAMWRRLPPSEAYTMGNPMYFQADGPPLAKNERLFVDSCYVTTNSSHLSMPRYTVIKNHGCMTESKSSRGSRFIQSEERNVVRFSLDAFMFSGETGKHLYMHCEIFVGSVHPTPSSKSCTYNQATKRWDELYEKNSVCLCCDKKCLASKLPVTSKVITSDVWTMESDFVLFEEEQTPSELDGGMVQMKATLAPDTDSHYYVTGMALMEKEDKFEEPRRLFEEVFGLD